MAEAKPSVQAAAWLAGPGTGADQADSVMRLMKEVLERLPQGVVMFDADGNVAFANRRYSEIYTCIPQVACRLR